MGSRAPDAYFLGSQGLRQVAPIGVIGRLFFLKSSFETGY
jgi:hypothetical protein